MATDPQGQPPAVDDTEIRRVVESFYRAFNAHELESVGALVTEGWIHINPLGGVGHGREAVIEELKEVHASLLRGVSDEPEEMSVTFATSDVAVVVVPSRLSPFSLPDGTRFEDARPLRTFVVVKRDGSWRILLDQNTFRGR